MYKLTALILLLVSSELLLKLSFYFEKYIFQDWGFAGYLIVPIILDTIIGSYRAKKQGKFKWKEFDKIVDKLITYMTILILVHVMTSFTVDDTTITVFHWMRVTVFSALMAKEGYSILKNLAALNKGYVPVWLLRKLQQVDKTGKFFTDEEIEQNKIKEQEFIKEVMETEPEKIEEEIRVVPEKIKKSKTKINKDV
jgi:phage-related holin